MDEIIIHENQTDIYKFLNKGNKMIEFTLKDFEEQCMPRVVDEILIGAKYDIRPNDTVMVDGVLHSIKIDGTKVTFEEIGEKNV